MGPISRAREAFSDIYERNVWGKGSGVGSEVAHTRDYVSLLNTFIAENKIKSVVDFGCGDWQFSRQMDWSGIRYYGFDVVPSLIEANNAAFAIPNITFHLVEDGIALPSADLVLCKDVLQHLPIVEVRRYLELFKALYRNIVITNDVWPEANLNVDIEPGQCRPLRLDLPPFDEALDILLTWEVNAYGSSSTKQTCLLRGVRTSPPQSLILNDRNAPADVVAQTKRSMLHALRELIRDTPLAPLARGARRLLTRGRP